MALSPTSSHGTSSTVGTEVAYVEFTGNVSVTAVSEATADTIVTAGAFTADGTSAYLVEFFAPQARPDTGAINRSLNFALYLDGSSVGGYGALAFASAGSNVVAVRLSRRTVAASGSRTYSIRGYVSAGTGLIVAGAGGSGNNVPGFVRVTKVT